MPSTADERPILVTKGLTKSFQGFVAVRDVNLAVHRGFVHAIIGPNGAGKTTCFNLLTKFLQPSAGHIYFDDQDITSLPAPEVARLGMVRSFQISAVFPNLTALENVRIALQRRRGHNFDFWRSERTLGRYDESAARLLDEVGLIDFRNEFAGRLAYGRKRSLEIATTLALHPRVLLLDEPTAGMAQEDVERTTELIRRVAASRTVIMVEHNLSVVSSLANQITVLSRGEVLAEGDYAAISNNPRVVESYIGEGRV